MSSSPSSVALSTSTTTTSATTTTPVVRPPPSSSPLPSAGDILSKIDKYEHMSQKALPNTPDAAGGGGLKRRSLAAAFSADKVKATRKGASRSNNADKSAVAVESKTLPPSSPTTTTTTVADQVGSTGRSAAGVFAHQRKNSITSLEEIQALEAQAAAESESECDGADSADDNVSRHNETVIESGTCERCHTTERGTNRSRHSHHHQRDVNPASLLRQGSVKSSTGKELVLAADVPAPASDKSLMSAQGSGPQRKRRLRHHDVADSSVYKLNMFRWLELSLRRALWYLGNYVAQYNTVLLAVPIFVLIMCSIGFVLKRSTFEFSCDVDSMYVRRQADTSRFTGPLLNDKGLPVFNLSNPAFNAIDRRSPGHFSVILKAARHGRTIMDAENMEAYEALRNRLIGVQLIDSDQQPITYDDLCTTQCNDVLSLLTNAEKAVQLTYPETLLDFSNGTTRRMFLGATFGGVETNPDGTIARARSLAMYYRLREPRAVNDYVDPWLSYDLMNGGAAAEEEDLVEQPHPKLDAWAGEFAGVLQNVSAEPTYARLYPSWWSWQSFTAAVADGFESAYMYALISVAIVAFGLGCACARKDSYSSKPFCALAAFVAVMCSCAGGVSLEFGFTGVFEPATIAVYFYVTAVGVLLSVSSVHAWHKYSNVAIHPAEKCAFIMAWDAPCVVAICLMIVTSLAITGAATSVPFFAKCCFVGAACFSLLLVSVVFIVNVGMYLTGRREAAGLKWFQFWQNGDQEFPERTSSDEYDEGVLQKLHRKLTDQEPSTARQFGSAIASVHFRFMTVLLISIYLIFAVWGCTQMPVRFEEDTLLPTASQPRQFIDDYRTYYGRNEDYIELIFDNVLDYMNGNTRAAIFNLIEWAQKEKYATRAVSWLADFVGFNRTTRYEVRQDTFVAVVHRVFLRFSRYEAYSADIAFAPLHTQIIASRMYLQLSQKGKTDQLALINGLKDLAEEAELPLRVRAPSLFLLTHDMQIVETTVIACALLVCLFSICTMLAVAEPFSACLSLLACASTAAGAFGIGKLCGLVLSAPVAATILVGLCYTAALTLHFCYHFLNAGSIAETSQQRMEYAMESCLAPMLWSTVITVLAFLPLLAVGMPFLADVAKLIALQMVISCAHVVFAVAPAMLLVADHVPRGCGAVKSCASMACGACCQLDEDAASIYYIPTTTAQSVVDHETLRRCLRDQYGQDVHVLNPLSVQGVPERPMIMPPPSIGPGGSVLSDDGNGLVIGYGRIRGGGRRRRSVSSRGNAHSPPPSSGNRDSSPAAPARHHESGAPPSSSSLHRPSASAASRRALSDLGGGRRGHADDDDDDTASLPDDIIYEEPPPLPEPNPKQPRRHHHQQPQQQHRSHHHHQQQQQRAGGGGYHHHQHPPTSVSGGSMDLRPNWRQYMLDGNVRRHRVVEVPAVSMPVALAPPPPAQVIALGPPPPQATAIMHPAGRHYRYQ